MRSPRRQRQKKNAGGIVIALDPELMTEDPSANLAMLERAARASIAFGRDLPFDDRSWIIQEKTANQRKVTLWFTVHRDREDGVKNVRDRKKLQEPFGIFLKSVIRLAEAANPAGSVEAHEAMLSAGRYLHDQLAHRRYNPAELVPQDFYQAERAAGQRVKSNWSHFAASQWLLKLATIVDRYRLSQHRIDFKPLVNAPALANAFVEAGPDPDRLPSEAALKALPIIAQSVTDPSDVRAMRIIELLHCAPFRIGEVLSLPVDCEVVLSADGLELTTKALDDGTVGIRYGIRFRPEKTPGWTSDVKWIPSAAIPLARRALADLRKHTAQAREVAAYMEANPGRAWLPPRYRERERLTIDDVAETLGITRKQAFTWLHRYKVAIRPCHVLRHEFETGLSTTLSAKQNEKALIECARTLLRNNPDQPRFDVDTTLKSVIRVGLIYRWLRVKRIPVYPETVSRIDLEKAILSLNGDVAPDFPWKLSECLVVSHKPRLAMQPIIELIDKDQVRYFLTGDANCESIFEKLNFEEPDGRPIHITSHAFRRWLSTLAVQQEMSAQQVENWLGHKSGQESSAYDQRTPEERAKAIRAAFGDGLLLGPLADIARAINEPKDRDTFLETILATAHVTQYGMCARDWLSNPCVRHGACASCEKQMILKGDAEHKKSIARSLRENRILLARAQEEAEDGQRGANNHARHLAREVAALEATMAIHDDPSVADGSYVQLDLPALLDEVEG